MLAACGGGESTSSQADGGAKAVSRTASAKDTATPITWVSCAVENQTCTFTGTRAVRYGAATQFVTGTYTGQVSCSNSVFGDPLPGVGKACSYAADPPATANWVFCADENAFCAFAGTATVQYGAGTSVTTGSFTNGVACANSVFGDPAYGQGKSCSYLLAATPATSSAPWVSCAVENQTCAFSGTRAVRYGTATQYVTGTYTSQVSCANSVFGDPSPGVGKACTYAGDPPAGANWIFCANENQFCTFAGTATVQYGAGTSVTTGSFTNGVACANSVFGDPAYGQGKSCGYVLAASTGATSAATTAATTAGTATAASASAATVVAPAPVYAAPVITVQPQLLVVLTGQAATFSVVATSADPATTYQWSRGGSAIGGATASTYTIAATQLADSGAIFSVVVTNSVGDVTSSSAGLTVNAVLTGGASAQRLFADQSLWNARPTQFVLGSNVIPTSNYYPYIGGGIYSVAGAIASSSDPAVTVVGLANQPGLYVPDAETYVASMVIPHWPAGVMPAVGSDGHADIIDVANDRIHSFWQLSQDTSGQWHAAQYTWTPLDGSGWGTPGAYQQGSRASGVVPTAGLIRVSEVGDGLPMYRHALTMSLTYNALSASPAFAFPATTADFGAATTNSGSIPEGARMMLPAGFDASAITDPQLLKIVRTLQTYGAYVTDRNYGTPFFIYVENGTDFNLMPNGWDQNVANQLDSIRAALRQIVTVTQWVDATGAVFTPNQNPNLFSMRGPWIATTGSTTALFDTWQQAVVFPANGQRIVQTNNSGRSMPWVTQTAPVAGKQFRFTVHATGGAQLHLVLNGQTQNFDSGVMNDGDSVVVTWPAGSASPLVTALSGPQGGGTVSGTMVQLN